MDQPTLSPQSNRLIELCEAVMTGKTDAQELGELLDEVNAGLEKAVNDFIQQVSQQGDSYKEQMQQETENVLQSFEQYQAGLEQISLYLQGQDVQMVQNGIHTIIEATNNILNNLTIYESKSLQLGPTSFPILNMLILLTESFNKGDIPEDEYRFMIYNAGQFFTKIIDELDGYEGDKALDAIATLKEGYNKFLDGLEKLDEGALQHNELIIEDALEIIRESQEIIKQGYSKFSDEMFLSGPTDSPVANILISAIEGHKDGVFPKDILVDTLNKYEETVLNLRRDVEGLMAIPTENQDLEGEFPRTQQSFDLLEEGIERVRMYLQDSNMQHLNQAVEKIKEGTLLLKDSKEVYDDIGEREGKVACIKCGHLNDSSDNVCRNCNAVMPKIPGMTQSTFQVGEAGVIDSGAGFDFVMTENVKRLGDASADVRDGRISFQEYEKVLNWMDAKLVASLADVEKNPTINVDIFPEDQKELALKQKEIVDDTLEAMREALEKFQEGILQLRQFGVDDDVEHLRQGLTTILEASMQIQEVQKVTDTIMQEAAKMEAARKNAASEQGQAPEQEEEPGREFQEPSDSVGSDLSEDTYG